MTSPSTVKLCLISLLCCSSPAAMLQGGDQLAISISTTQRPHNLNEHFAHDDDLLQTTSIHRTFSSWEDFRAWIRKLAERLGIVQPSPKARQYCMLSQQYDYTDDAEESCGSCCSPCNIGGDDSYDDVSNVAFITIPDEYEQLVIQRYHNYLVIYSLTESYDDGSWEYSNAVKLYNVATHEWLYITLNEAYDLTNQLPPLPPR